MLVGERSKYLGMIIGLTFASLIMTQQAAIFLGLMRRTYAFVEDTSIADVWVMDPRVEFVDDSKPMSIRVLPLVRGAPGVDWAVPMYKGLVMARLPGGRYQQVNIVGLDDASLIGGPHKIIEGSLAALRIPDSFIVDEKGAQSRLIIDKAVNSVRSGPLGVGDVIEVNDRRALCVGVAQVSRTFQSQPVLYTTFSRALQWAPSVRRHVGFILVKAAPQHTPAQVARSIEERTGLKALTAQQFKNITIQYFIKKTGIAINFGMAVLLGFIIGAVIVGQTFFSFTIDNLRYLATLKAMGATNRILTLMVLLQAMTVGLIGYGLGTGIASAFGVLVSGTELSFRLPWWLLLGSLAAVLLISAAAALLSVRKVIKLEPAIVFKS